MWKITAKLETRELVSVSKDYCFAQSIKENYLKIGAKSVRVEKITQKEFDEIVSNNLPKGGEE